jgi:hypothetical protein
MSSGRMANWGEHFPPQHHSPAKINIFLKNKQKNNCILV